MSKPIQLVVVNLFIIGGLFFSGCATNPVTGKQDFVLMTEAQEINLGKKAHKQIMRQYRPYDNPVLQNYVESIVEELSKKSHREKLIFHVTILDSPQVNAFALPGGYVYITRGIMSYMNSEAELAGVLGHEIGHITARHGVRQQTVGTLTGLLGTGIGVLTGNSHSVEAVNVMGTALVRGYGRKHELEADRLGAEYLARVGYDPEEMINVVEILKSQEDFDKQLAEEEGREPRAYHGTFSTHPANDKRLQEVVMAANKFESAATREPNREGFLNHLDGIVVGPSEKDGVIRGNKFYHGSLNLFVEFPRTWRIDNLPDRLLAQPQGGDAQFQIMVTDLNKRQTPKEYLTERTKGKLSKGQSVQTLDFQGYTGHTLFSTRDGELPGRVAAIFDGKRVYEVAMASKDQSALDTYDDAALTTIKSLRNLKSSEVSLAKSKHIKLVRTKSGDTFASLAKKSDLSHHPIEQLRLLNGMYPDGEPTSGQVIKIIQ
jgi:predicted Zn-dependent protease